MRGSCSVQPPSSVARVDARALFKSDGDGLRHWHQWVAPKCPGFIRSMAPPKPDASKRHNNLVCDIVKQKAQCLHFNSEVVDARDEQPPFYLPPLCCERVT
jgi:hypothetical protein